MTPILTQTQALDLFSRYRATSTPLLSYTTPDGPASQHALVGIVRRDDPTDFPNDAPSPLLSWDVIRGLSYINDEGKQALATMKVTGPNLLNPAAMLEAIARVPPHTVVFVHNPHLFWTGPDKAQVLQGILNLREPYKTNWRTLVLVHHGDILPAELERDVVVIEEPLPGPDVLAEKVQTLLAAARVNTPAIPEASPALLEKATSALAGLSLFSAEQVVSVSIRESGLDLDAVRERARQQIKNTPGLSVHVGAESFDGLGGLANVKRFCRLVKDGNEPPLLIGFLDEIEKQVAGYGTDSSGVATNQMGQILQEMEDTKSTGFIEYGQPGTGKTEVAKALARELDTFVLRVDLGAMKDKLVGQSEARLRSALRVIRAIGQGRTLWVATSNGLTTLPAELRSRFSLGTFFFDLPTVEERATIWKVHEAAWRLTKDHTKARPDDTDWTGREIAACCRNAYRLKLTLAQAAEYVVPVARADRERIQARRQEAHGRYISASQPGIYRDPSLTGPEAQAEVIVNPRAVRVLKDMKES